MDRTEVGRKVMETSQVISEGYTRAISAQFQSEAEQDANVKCAVAASNTGYFILKSLGFTGDEISAMAAEYVRQKQPAASEQEESAHDRR